MTLIDIMMVFIGLSGGHMLSYYVEKIVQWRAQESQR